ncbi:MAG: sugar ABC transporter ATP-binding protein, partial [Candidatus Paceibacterota bacterium]
MTESCVLRMEGISKSFPGVLALDKVHFELLKGEVHVLLGENGAGKSTLMKILSGAYVKDEGDITIDDKLIEIESPAHAQNLGIGIIYQEFNLNPYLSVAENIFLGREPTILPGIIDWKKIYKNAQDILDSLCVEIDAKQIVETLGVAMQQMVEVAKALSLNARILIMDEPTASLSNKEIEALFKTIKKLQDDGVAIIYISHRLEEIFRIGNRVTVLRDGKYVGTKPVSELTKDEMVKMMVNRDLDDHIPKIKAEIGDVVLEVDNVSVKDRLKDISFKLR